MDYSIVPVRQLNEEQTAEIARMHHQTLPSLLSDLGLPFVGRYYQIARGDEAVIGFCALSDDGTPLGWVVGSSRPDQVNGRLREPLSWFVPQLTRALLSRPRLIWQLFVSSRSSSFRMAADCIELTYLGVAPSVRRRGLGMELLKTFAGASVGTYRCITLSVEAENAAAIRLYTKAGYKVTDNVTEGKFRRHRMELKLSHEGTS